MQLVLSEHRGLRIGRILGIPIAVHWSLGILVALELVQTMRWFPFPYALWAFAGSGLVIGSILVHELAHALVGRRLGARTSHIVLHAFGGVAFVEGRLTDREQILVSLAGPISNILLWLLFNGLVQLIGHPVAWTVLGGVASLNLILGLFNLIPAVPLDGGNILVSALRMRAPPAYAHWLAFHVGCAIAGPLVVVGLFTNQFILALIFTVSFQTCQAGLAGLGPVDGWGYWRVCWFARGPRPVQIDWAKYGARPPTVLDHVRDWFRLGRRRVYNFRPTIVVPSKDDRTKVD